MPASVAYWEPYRIYKIEEKKLRQASEYVYSTQSAFICSKLTTETLEQGVKYIQS